jgi:hypothetical protein
VRSYHAHVIIWLDGTFGYGKTSTAAELHSLVPAADSLDSHLGGARTLTLPGRIGPVTRESA